jgi:hypothetical protein
MDICDTNLLLFLVTKNGSGDFMSNLIFMNGAFGICKKTLILVPKSIAKSILDFYILFQLSFCFRMQFLCGLHVSPPILVWGANAIYTWVST